MTLKTLSLGIAALLMAAPAADAAMINTIIGNFDVAFDGMTGELTDFNRPLGGNLSSAEARTFSSIEIEVDGVSEEMLMNPPDALFGDLLIPNLGASLTTGSLVSNAGGDGDINTFGFDYFDGLGNSLRLGIDDISYTLVTTGIPGLNVFAWFAEAKVLSQSLPGGFQYGEDVVVSYTASEVMVINGGATVVASGAMTITGALVPEPSAAVLAALTGLAGVLRRR